MPFSDVSISASVPAFGNAAFLKGGGDPFGTTIPRILEIMLAWGFWKSEFQKITF